MSDKIFGRMKGFAEKKSSIMLALTLKKQITAGVWNHEAWVPKVYTVVTDKTTQVNRLIFQPLVFSSNPVTVCFHSAVKMII